MLIVVNGYHIEGEQPEISYEQLATLTNQIHPAIAYIHGPQKKRAGILHPGESVTMVRGMCFSVVSNNVRIN